MYNTLTIKSKRTDQPLNKQLNRKYAASHAINSGLLATMLAFASIFLLDKGFANSTIGMILALCNVAAIIVQTFFANLTAKRPLLKLQDMLTFMLIVIILASLTLFISPSPTLFLFAVILAFSFAQSNTPFVNSMAFIYEEEGIQINYGVGRGFGSLAYALINLILGFMIEKTSPGILPLLYIILALIFIFIIRSYRLPADHQPVDREMKPEVELHTVEPIPVENQSLAGFFSKYRHLSLVILGLSFVLFSQTLIGTFMIQIVSPLGGDSSTVGLAIFIAAAIEFPVMMNFDRLLKKRSAAFWLKLAVFFYICKIGIILSANSIWLVYLSQSLQFGSYALAYPAAVQYIKNSVDKQDLFKGQTIFTIGTTMSAVFASFMGGLILDNFGVSSMLLTAFFAVFIGGFIIYSTLNKLPVEQLEVVKVQK